MTQTDLDFVATMDAKVAARGSVLVTWEPLPGEDSTRFPTRLMAQLWDKLVEEPEYAMFMAMVCPPHGAIARFVGYDAEFEFILEGSALRARLIARPSPVEPPPWPQLREFQDGPYRAVFGRNQQDHRVVLLTFKGHTLTENLDRPSVLGEGRERILTHLWEHLSAGGLVGFCCDVAVRSLEALAAEMIADETPTWRPPKTQHNQMPMPPLSKVYTWTQEGPPSVFFGNACEPPSIDWREVGRAKARGKL